MMRFGVAVLLWVLGLGASAQRVEVVLIGGQSNATGQGLVANLPQQYRADTAVWIFHSPYLHSGRAAHTWLPLGAAGESPERFGPELGLGNELRRLAPDRQWALVKHGLSGSNLFRQWNPGNRPGEVQGDEYRKFIETARAALQSLRAMGYQPVLRALAWQQGEADARFDTGAEHTNRYGANLKNFIEAVRHDLEAPELVLVVGEVMPVAAERFTGRDTVRSAQRQVAQGVKGVYIVACDDLQMRRNDYRSPDVSDDVHFGTFGLLNLGERYAQAMIKALHVH